MPSPAHPAAERSAAALWARLPCDLVTARGSDAVRFVDNFATAALASLEPGDGHETFFTDAKGWVIALVTALRTDDGLLMVTAAGLGDRLRDHLEHYHIRESVELEHAAGATARYLVAGPAAAEAVAAISSDRSPADPFGHREIMIGGGPVRLAKVAGQGLDGFWILAPAAAAGDVERSLAAAGLAPAAAAEIEAARIMAAFPAAADIPPRTLPQELDLDARAISFTKGCYLGQETVARIDAVGHVNRRLVRLAFAPPLPAMPAAVRAAGGAAGMLTSAAASPTLGGAVGLAIVPTRLLAAGDFEVAGRPARVAGATAAAPADHPDAGAS